MSSENVRFSRSLTHQSLLRATKGDVDDIETSLLSQVVAKQQLEILEEEEKQQGVTEEEQTKVKRKEMKKQHEADKEAKSTTAVEIHKERQQEERRKLERDKISGPKETVTVEVQDSGNLVTQDTTITDKQQQEDKSDNKQPPTTASSIAPTAAPTVLFKHLKNQYQSISEKLKEQEERELARRATLESRKKDAAQIRAARQSQKRTEVVTTNGKNEEEREDCNEIVIQLDQMGSYAAFNDNDHHDNATMGTQHKRHTESIKSSVGDDEYYQQMTNNTTHIIASKAT